MTYDFRNINPREALNAWEAQAFALLTIKGYPTSFRGVSELTRDDSLSTDCLKAVQIVFWGRIWRQAKTKEEVTTAWNHILNAVKNSNFQSKTDGIKAGEISESNIPNSNEVTKPILERIAELKMEGLIVSEVVERGFKEETVKKVFKENG
jgi:hypothetical protein